jgi:hypothetical protein
VPYLIYHYYIRRFGEEHHLLFSPFFRWLLVVYEFHKIVFDFETCLSDTLNISLLIWILGSLKVLRNECQRN